MENEETVIVLKRAEIDTNPAFRSVKEAVTLFGDKVLAGELYASKLKKIHVEESENGQSDFELGILTAELEETKQSLEKAKEESTVMANSLSSLQKELERTRRKLQKLKQREAEKQEPRVVEEGSMKFEVNKHTTSQQGFEFQRKRYVTLANPPSLAQVTVPQGAEALERHPSLRKKKKKKNALIPLIGGIFSKKKGGHFASPREA
ncbi:hypothetical protein K2173_027686 [Erythroxylum novogranatense]|uniref:WEB family protein n=1 Tax=Erythroxylum novogranatense TaxID=1862640 RepID=A0AAV8U2P9_9ROSI|nr:hypothetical protein K2173_027686 [Erythroxylum novogranatense]